jgi:hypothetical protein
VKLSANAVRLAYQFAATSDIRYYLNGVHVDPHPNGGAAITGCDGHRVLQVHDRDATDVETMIISLDKASRAALKPGRFVQTEFEPGRAAVVDSKGIPVHLQALGYKVEAKYPDVKATALGERESWVKGIRGTFNVGYLADASQAVAAAIGNVGFYDRFVGVTFYCKGPHVPLTAENDRLLFIVEGKTPAWGVIMGMRGDAADPSTIAYPERKAA